ncbi:ribosome small subunit-dependent GTPase A [Arthrobacter sp. CAU 1506]|uniref:ribosome small subunit-dependent GTPase A n=1 Tax=Arthrobacter sp. CAU 1506 TaxID=2560052 RepID=UPI001F0F9EA3|nr:ribosome small subunit-dependent GTPase A [Arthrobacter sp. CAU 1506]
MTDQPTPHSLLHSYGYTDRIAALFRDQFSNPRLRPARVVRTDRGRVLLATDSSLLHLTTAGLPQPPATGDWVAFEPGRPASAGGPAIAGLLPRFSVLSRKQAYDPLSTEQILATNMDLIGVVVPFDRPLSANRLERTLVAVWDSGAAPLVILTKADLCGQHDEVAAQIVEQAAGAEVLATSAETGDGIDALAGHLGSGRSMALLGPSGAGKSSLINALVGRDVQDAGAVRAGDGKGRHTTTARELIPLPNGAVLMDTPGIRGFALWDAEDGLGTVFGDIEELAADCRFNDCSHETEPGCAVRQALADGSLERRRWESYRKMGRELANLHLRQNVAEQRRTGRQFAKLAKAAAQAKDYRGRREPRAGGPRR